ncbi:MAG TPA: Rossmann-like and DUF2520 domain-containing protein [Pyrinomonadaceae bacterium]|jgi:predicted short-subunit dehydrogenase-like oxidoreductase (DUF2520 family)|nr:Rossmann-like and DUF2520 domain-containing protein [Pyrinomonadaceae bacterium]
MPRQTRAAKKIDDEGERAARAATTHPPAEKVRRKEKRVASKKKRVAPKSTVAVVGAGRVGTALAVALERCGYRVTALVARRRSHARRASRLLRNPPPALGSAELGDIPDSDILIIATPDDRVAETARRIGAERKSPRPVGPRAPARGRVALHVSGSLSSDALAPLRALGFAAGSLHPLVSVSDAAAGADDLRGAYYCVEGDAEAARVARRLVRDLGGHAFSVRPGDKALYHAAAVMAAGHLTALFDVATSLLARCGVGAKTARLALLTLSASALQNLARAPDNARALTGPFARRDLDTIRKHLDALGAARDGAALRLYATLGARSLGMTARGATDEDLSILRELERALEEFKTGADATGDDS